MDFKFLFFTVEGRTGRQDWWIGYGVLFVVNIVVTALYFIQVDTISWVATIILLILMYPYVVLRIKRCHDRNRSGWFLLVGLISLTGGIWLLVELACLQDTNGANRFGPDPMTSPDPLTKQ